MVIAILLGLLLLSGCTQQAPGPDIDPTVLTTPQPVAAPAPPPRPALTPETPTGQFAAWEPYRCLPSGECVEGHWVTIPLSPPRLEVLEPARPIPRAPRVPTVLKRSQPRDATPPRPEASPADRSHTTPSMAPLGLPAMQLPPGMGLEQIQEQMRQMQGGGR